jgi:hypothetical protein
LILDRDHHLGLPVLRLVTLCIHAIATTPAGLVKLIRSYPLTRIGLPLFCGRSAPALAFSRPAQRSLSLRPACSPGLHETLCTGGFSGFIASTTAPIVTGRNDPVPGWDSHPLLSNAFSRRTHFLANFPIDDDSTTTFSKCMCEYRKRGFDHMPPTIFEDALTRPDLFHWFGVAESDFDAWLTALPLRVHPGLVTSGDALVGEIALRARPYLDRWLPEKATM